MINVICSVMFQIILMLLISVSCAKAQYIIEEKDSRIPVNYDLLPEGKEFENPVDEAKYFLNLPEEKLRSDESEVEETKSTMYLDADNFTMETESAEEGKVSSIFNGKQKTFYYVLWGQKRVFQMNDEDMKQVRKDVDNMKERMMEGLSPEMRKQMEEQQNQARQSKAVKVKATGKKMKIYGFDCAQYMVESEEEVKIIWASDDLPGLRKSYEKFMRQMTAIFPSEEEDEAGEWELVKGKIPIESRTIRNSEEMMGMPEIEITALTRITRVKPPSEKFTPPSAADGFVYGSMKDLVSGMMQMIHEK
jgi:hypothetical protein